MEDGGPIDPASGSIDEMLGRLFASDPAVMADPWPVWARLHREAPIHRHGSVAVFVRHADVKHIVTRTDAFTRTADSSGSRVVEMLGRLTPAQRAAWDDFARLQSRMLFHTEHEDHARIRSVMHRAFTPRRIARMQELVDRELARRLDELAGQGRVDLKRLSYELPLRVANDLVELRYEDRELVHDWCDAFAANLLNAEPDNLEDAAAAANALREYVGGLIAEHRASPGSNELISSLLDANEEDTVDDDELAASFVLLLFAAHQTVSKLISIGMLSLLRHRDQWELLCAQPELAPRATEELLRFVAPTQWLVLVSTRDQEVAGFEVREGETVIASLAGANRDPAVFADPDVLDLRRENAGQHLAFGHGVHYCLGVSLARLEGTTVFRGLAERFPGARLVDGEPLQWRSHAMLRALDSLPIHLDEEATDAKIASISSPVG